MLTVEQALAAVLERARPLPPTHRPLAELPGLVLAEDVAADIDLPPFDKALMDGYAVRAADVPGPGTVLWIGEAIPAGRIPSRPLAPGEAAIIMTGAPLPDGADTVVPHEQTEQVGEEGVRLDGPIKIGSNIMPRGREMRAGDILLKRGTVLNACHVGVLASAGRAQVLVIPEARVVVVPTGDELVEPDRVPGPGQIRNSHAVMLGALARRAGAEALVAPIAPDEPEGLRAALAAALASADVLLITGGVSAGQRDLVPDALAALDVIPIFHKVRLKPGKPLLFGVAPRGPGGGGPDRLVFGLPGNPVSGLVGFQLFVRPALEALRGLPGAGASRAGRRTWPLAAAFTHRGDRPTYYPAALDMAGDQPVVRPLDWAGSADLRTAAMADGFAIFPPGDRDYQPGEPVEFLPMLA